MKRRIICLLLLSALGLMLSACGKKSAVTTIAFSDKGASVKGSAAQAVKIEGDTVTITRSGSFDLSGTAKMQLIVDVEGGKAVYLNLNGLDLSYDTSAPVWIKNASMVVITLGAGSQNTITDRHLYVPPEEDSEKSDNSFDIPSAAIYSRAPLFFDGSGKLTVNAESYNGISTSDTFTMKNGHISITAEHHGIRGKDYVVISNGNLNIKCEGDGIKSTNTEKPNLGYINITGGNININADDEGIYAASSISVSEGTLTLKTKKTAFLTPGAINLTGGIIDIKTDSPAFSAAQSDIKDSVLITLNGRPYKR